MIMRILGIAAVLALIAAPAYANNCPLSMGAIDAALAGGHGLGDNQLADVKALRAEGEELHNSGKHAESVATLAKAMKLLGI